MIRPCNDSDFETIYQIINEAAVVYKGVIPADRWKEPYMPREELRHEIDHDVDFWGYEEEGELLGVMGIQHVQDVTLIRHAYVKISSQKQGIGGKLLFHLRLQTSRPLLIGTWADATWAVRFYQKHGFRLVTPEEKTLLLKKYWSIPERQVETSVVLAEDKWKVEQEMLELTDEQKAAYYKRSYTAVDGLWFMKVEERYGFDTALDIDDDVWKVVPKIQARLLKSMGNLKDGLDALRQCLTTRLSLDGHQFQTEQTDHGSVLKVTITQCPWHNVMIKSGREHLSGKVGTRICNTEYAVLAAEFGDNIKFELGQQICEDCETCTLLFKVSK